MEKERDVKCCRDQNKSQIQIRNLRERGFDLVTFAEKCSVENQDFTNGAPRFE